MAHPVYIDMKMYIHIHIWKSSYKENNSNNNNNNEKSLINLSDLSTNLSNTLKRSPKIFFDNELLLVNSPSCFFIGIYKKLTRVTMSIKSVVVLTIRRISEPITAINTLVSPNFRTRKLGEITVFFAVDWSKKQWCNWGDASGAIAPPSGENLPFLKECKNKIIYLVSPTIEKFSLHFDKLPK